MNNAYYEIRVTGTVPAEALLDFERMNVSVEPVETVLHGPMTDQGALNGLLARLELFGVEVVEVRRLKGTQPPASGSPPGESELSGCEHRQVRRPDLREVAGRAQLGQLHTRHPAPAQHQPQGGRRVAYQQVQPPQ